MRQADESLSIRRVVDHPVFQRPQPGRLPPRAGLPARRLGEALLSRADSHQYQCRQSPEQRQAAPSPGAHYFVGASGSAARSSSIVQSLGSVSPMRTDFACPSMYATLIRSWWVPVSLLSSLPSAVQLYIFRPIR